MVGSSESDHQPDAKGHELMSNFASKQFACKAEVADAVVAFVEGINAARRDH